MPETFSSDARGLVKQQPSALMVWMTPPRLLFAANVFSRLCAVLAMIFCARVLSGDEFASVAFAQVTVVTVAIAANYSMNVAATRFISRHRASCRLSIAMIRRFQLRTLLVTTISCLGFAAAVPFCLHLFPLLPHLGSVLYITAVSLFFYSLSLTDSGILMGQRDLRGLSFSMIVGGLVTILTILPAVWWGGEVGATISFLAGFAAQWLAGRRSVQKHVSNIGNSLHTLVFLNKMEGAVWRLCTPLMFATLLVLPANWISQVIVGKYIDVIAIGQLSVALQWYGMILFVPSFYNRLRLPDLSERSAGASVMVGKYLRENVFIASIFALPVIILAPTILSLYSVQMKDATSLLQVFAVVAVLNAMSSACGQVLVATRRGGAALSFNALWMSVTMASLWILLPHYGLLAVGLAYGLGYIMHTTGQLLYMSRLWTRGDRGSASNANGIVSR